MRVRFASLILLLSGLSAFAADEPLRFRGSFTFLYDGQRLPDRIELTGRSIGDLFFTGALDIERVMRLLAITRATFGKDVPEQPELMPARTLEESLAFVRGLAPSLNREEKLGLLFLILDKASAGYDRSQRHPGLVAMEQVFENALNDGQQGGICGNIHAFGALYATALGFENADSHSAMQSWSEDGNAASGHVLLHFRDPETKEYYVQNYESIINTHQLTETGALEFSDRLSGVFATTIVVQDRRDDGSIRTHLYVPRVSRWISRLLQSASARDPGEGKFAGLDGTLGNRERVFQITFGEAGPAKYYKVFGLGSRFDSDTGPIDVAAAGVAGGYQRKGFEIRGQAGLLHTETPTVDARVPYDSRSRDSLFFGFSTRGYVENEHVTGAIEARALSSDYHPAYAGSNGAGLSAPDHEIAASLEVRTPGARIGVSRHWEFAADTLEHQHPEFQTSFDQFDLIIEGLGGERRVYLVSESRVFVFEGLERFSASAIRQKVKAMLSTRAGKFTAGGQIGLFLSNRSRDAFYDHPLWSEVSLEWRKTLGGNLELGGSGLLSSATNPFFRMQELDHVTPDIQGGSQGRRALGWARLSWGSH